MIQQETHELLEFNTGATQFTTAMNSTMFKMLTKDVYSNLVMAVIREWSTNAIDACIAAGKEPMFDVHLPTTLEQWFSVRDYGTGLELDDIEDLFTILGASTKRTSNDFNGCFGIGRMAGLAYSDSFEVDSYINGRKISCAVVLNEGIPSMVVLGETITDEPNGLNIRVTVKAEDNKKFITTATNVYQFFEYRPNTNIPLTYSSHKAILKGKGWEIPDTSYSDTYHKQCVAVMSNVAYTISQSHVNMGSLRGITLRLDVPNGALTFNPGRETLSYDAATVSYLENTFKRIEQDITNDIGRQIAMIPNGFEKAIAYNKILNSLNYSLQGILKQQKSSYLPKAFAGNGRFYSTDLGIGKKITMKTYGQRGFTVGFAPTKDTHIIIIDTRSKNLIRVDKIATEIKSKFSGANIRIISPTFENAQDFHEAVSSGKFTQLADYFGNPEHLHFTSQVVLPKTPRVTSTGGSQAVKSGEPFFIYHYGYRGKGGLITKYSDDLTFVYVPMSNTKQLVPYQPRMLTELYNAIKDLDIKGKKFMVIGVPKIGMQYVKTRPEQFMHIDTFITDYLKDFTVVNNDGLDVLHRFNVYATRSLVGTLGKVTKPRCKILQKTLETLTEHNNTTHPEFDVELLKYFGVKPNIKPGFTVELAEKFVEVYSPLLVCSSYNRGSALDACIALYNKTKN